MSSSTRPRRSGSKISPQGCGRGWSPDRKILLNSNHGSDDLLPTPLFGLWGKFLNDMAAKSTPRALTADTGASRLAQIRPICDRNGYTALGVLTLTGVKKRKVSE